MGRIDCRIAARVTRTFHASKSTALRLKPGVGRGFERYNCFKFQQFARFIASEELLFGIAGALLDWMKHVFAALLAASSILAPGWAAAAGAEARLYPAQTRTNLVDRWITNTTEVQMQINRFVTEFHTNWVKRVETNFVDLFATNVLTEYHTNWITQVRTNLVDRFLTNTVARTVTNTFLVDRLQTNFVRAYQTNLETLYLTNWTTVVALRTNWVSQPLTNLVEIEMPRESAPPVSSALTAPAGNEPLSLQANRAVKLTTNHQVEVQLTVAWAHAPGTPLQVQQWRIERADGSILCFGQDLEFKRALPPGTYKVLVKAQRDARSPLLAALGTLTVTPREVFFQQRPARSNSAS